MEDDFEEKSIPLNVWMSNALYDALKFLAQILLPASGALYFSLAQVWGLPASEQVVGTVTIVDTFLGAVLGLSSKKYKGATEGATVGFLDVTKTDEGTKMLLNFPGDPHDIVNHDKVTFKVRNSS